MAALPEGDHLDWNQPTLAFLLRVAQKDFDSEVLSVVKNALTKERKLVPIRVSGVIYSWSQNADPSSFKEKWIANVKGALDRVLFGADSSDRVLAASTCISSFLAEHLHRVAVAAEKALRLQEADGAAGSKPAGDRYAHDGMHCMASLPTIGLWYTYVYSWPVQLAAYLRPLAQKVCISLYTALTLDIGYLHLPCPL